MMYTIVAVCVCVCVSECVPNFSVLAAVTFSLRTQETPDLLSCCKKLSALDTIESRQLFASKTSTLSCVLNTHDNVDVF